MPDVQTALQDIHRMTEARQFSEALAQAQSSIKAFPQSREIAIKTAELLFMCKIYDRALGLFTNLHEIKQKANDKTELRVLVGIAECQIKKELYKEATELLEKLRQVAPEEPSVLIPLATCRRHAKQLAEAEAFADKALSKKANDPSGMHEKAQILLVLGREHEAIELLEANIRRPDLHGDSIDLWISTLEKQGRNRYAQDTLKELTGIHPNTLEFAYGHAVLSNQNGEIPEARKAFAKALALSPENPRILYEYGVLERIAGDLEYSQKLISKSLDIRPDSPAALRIFGSDLQYEYGDENYKRLNYVAAKFSEFTPVEQIHLHYALAKAAEGVGEMDAAFRHYSVGGAKKRKLDPYKEHETNRLGQIIPKIVTQANLDATNEKGSASDVPVFILGMPRSGTSLMEQILSAHPDVFGAGELKFLTGVLENIPVNQARIRMGDKEPVFDYDDKVGWAPRGDRYVERIQGLADKPYKRIVDKMPGNYNFVGLIHAILPNAKIIHSRRHPVETCLSCYRIFFAEGHQWTYNLTELGRYYRRYWDLMKYWREAFPGVMYEAIYEENVNDVETSAKNLISHLDLEWNDQCLEFYNVDRPVKTASLSQVRKPIYKTSTNRWRKYEKYLGPLLEEIGDIVEEYESEISHLIVK